MSCSGSVVTLEGSEGLSGITIVSVWSWYLIGVCSAVDARLIQRSVTMVIRRVGRDMSSEFAPNPKSLRVSVQ